MAVSLPVMRSMATAYTVMTSMRGKSLGPLGLRLAVFCHQRFAELLLGFPVFDDPYLAEQAHASIGEARIAFKPAVVKDAFLLINLKETRRSLSMFARRCPPALDVCKYTSPLIHSQRDTIGETVLAHGRETAAIALRHRLQRTFIRHGAVCAADLR